MAWLTSGDVHVVRVDSAAESATISFQTHDSSHPRTCFVTVPEGEAANFDFDPEEATRDDLPFFVGGQEYLARGEQLIKAQEVKALRNRRQFEGHTWFDVQWTSGEYTVQRADDLVGCDVERLIVDEKRKRRRRSKKRGQDAAEAEVSQPQQSGVQKAGDGEVTAIAEQASSGGEESGQAGEPAGAGIAPEQGGAGEEQ